MPQEFKLPELAEGVESAEVTRILVEIGDRIEEEQPVIELETGKATAEIPSSVSGIVKDINVSEGDEIAVGQVILTFEEDGEAESNDEPDEADPEQDGDRAPGTEPEETTEDQGEEEEEAPPRKAEKAASKREEASTPETEEVTTKEGEPSKTTELADVPGRQVAAAPSVRKFAREIGVNLEAVKGTGDRGRVFIEDVKKHARQLIDGMKGRSPAKGTAAPVTAAPPLPDFSRWGPVRRERRNMVARETAKHMAVCWSQIPHVTQHDVADVTELEELRHRYAGRAETAGGKLTITPMLAKIVASALKVFPKFNTSLDVETDELIVKEFCNIGIAVDTERGLLVPVIREVDTKNMVEISVEMKTVAESARSGKVDAEDLAGATFTITNLGGIGGTHFTPIVNWPEVAILGVGRAQSQPNCRNGVCEPRLLLPLSLSYDHRVIDGASGARFLRWIVEAIEEPLLLALEG